MDAQRKALKHALNKMSTKEATAYVKNFELRPDEEQVILLCDVKGESVTAVSFALHCSRVVVERKRTAGYERMLRDIGKNMPI
jgi:FixJ family two-component response regulator